MNNTSNNSNQSQELITLTSSEKRVLATLQALDNSNNCFATNAYLADTLFMSVRQVSRVISSLAKKGYIAIENPRSFKRKIKTVSFENLKALPYTVTEEKVDADNVVDIAEHKTKINKTPASKTSVSKTSDKVQKYNDFPSHDWDFDEIEMLERKYIDNKIKEHNERLINQS